MKFSFRTKIALYTMATTLFALVLAAFCFMYFLGYTMREGVASELRNMAAQLGDASIPAILFHDDITASELVDYKGLNNQILEAALFNADGQVFAQYVRDGSTTQPFMRDNAPVAQFLDDKAYITQPIQSSGKVVGYLHIYRDLSTFQKRMNMVGWIIAGILVGVLLLTLLTSTWLNRLIRNPMRELAQAASKVGQSEDGFSIRVQKQGEDELGVLTDTFNNMMDRLQERESDLRQSHARLRQVINLVPHMIFAKDHKGRLILVNQAMADAVGSSAESMLGTLAAKWFPRELHEVMERSDQEVIETGRPHFSEETFVNHSGEVINLQTTKIPYVQSGSQKNAILRISIDVTRAKKAEQALLNSRDELDRRVQEKTSELAQARARMDRQEKLALIGRISGNIAHELRNPLSAVRQSVYLIQILMDEGQDDQASSQLIQKHLAMIASEIESSNLVISNLLGATRVEKQRKKEKVDLADVLKLSTSRVWVEEWGRLNFEFSSEATHVWGDYLQLRQVFVNLLDNAKAAVANVEDAAVWITIAHEGDFAKVQITDNGHGMNEEALSRLFEPLFTTNPNGSGLGLSICREIVEDRHGGTIEFESTEGAGTQVDVSLPLYCPKEKLNDEVPDVLSLVSQS